MLRFSNGLLAALWVASLAACAKPSYDYVPLVQDISRPALGSVNTVGVGEQMLVQGRFEERDALILDRDTQVGTLGTYTFTAGHFVRVGGNGNVGFYNESAVPGSGRVQQGILADPFQVIEFNSVTNQICGVTIFNLKACRKVDGARVERVVVQSNNAFQQTLIYSGRVGSKINIGYREFSGNVARPAFNNDVEYDLSESKTIGYMGAQIEILDATNQNIQYRVIRNFNAAAR
ncbi:hypothetical protein [Brevundimonas aurantiaca]|jgi:hypothetical protein|uniref:Lipoprotein n=1 Tax=Brevundimonas aurantiaca TaxID=74316 RepID=A0A7W9FA96_9CAUL|nr:hypothetical protein [Brevundimonas aurantiaca]MBB5740173.1 hypothetical protein [Brevundimonas aurantiaca]